MKKAGSWPASPLGTQLSNEEARQFNVLNDGKVRTAEFARALSPVAVSFLNRRHQGSFARPSHIGRCPLLIQIARPCAG
jgi:hypothetical protein